MNRWTMQQNPQQTLLLTVNKLSLDSKVTRMGDHVNTKKDTSKHHKRGFAESRDIRIERARRVTFKKYVEELEEELLNDELEDDFEDNTSSEE